MCQLCPAFKVLCLPGPPWSYLILMSPILYRFLSKIITSDLEELTLISNPRLVSSGENRASSHKWCQSINPCKSPLPSYHCANWFRLDPPVNTKSSRWNMVGGLDNCTDNLSIIREEKFPFIMERYGRPIWSNQYSLLLWNMREMSLQGLSLQHTEPHHNHCGTSKQILSSGGLWNNYKQKSNSKL